VPASIEITIPSAVLVFLTNKNLTLSAVATAVGAVS
jgi:hypothetical protein